MLRKLGLGLVAVVVLVVAIVYAAGRGLFAPEQHAGSPSARSIDSAFIAEKEKAVHEAALDVGVARPKQILFGDLHETVRARGAVEVVVQDFPGSYPGRARRGLRLRSRRRLGLLTGCTRGLLGDLGDSPDVAKVTESCRLGLTRPEQPRQETPGANVQRSVVVLLFLLGHNL